MHPAGDAGPAGGEHAQTGLGRDGGLGQLLETLGIGLCRSTPDGRMLEVNDALVEIMGYESRAALMRRSIPELYVRSEDRDALLEQMLTEGTASGVEIPVEREDGSTTWTRLSGHAETGPDGRIESIACLIEKIDARRGAKQALAETQQRYRALIELSPLAIVLHQEGQIRFANRATADLLAAGAPDELVGEPVIGFVHPSQHDKARSRVARIYSGEALGPTEYRLLRVDGTEFPAEVQGTFVPFDGRPASQLIIRDITEQRRQQEEREAWMAELERSNEELEQFAHIVSHDLREPLRMLHQYATLLSDRLEPREEDIEAAVAHLEAGAARATEMLDALLRYSRVSTTEPSRGTVDLQAATEDALRNLELMVDKTGADVTVAPLGALQADRGQIVQLLQNLIENALRYSGDEPPRIEILRLQDGEGTHLVVQDHGIGMEPDQVDAAFAPFRQLDPETSCGTGIGLAICRRIVDRHAGEIWVRSEPGVGTAVHLRFPEPDRRHGHRPPIER